jgi:hypothetical protein
MSWDCRDAERCEVRHLLDHVEERSASAWQVGCEERPDVELVEHEVLEARSRVARRRSSPLAASAATRRSVPNPRSRSQRSAPRSRVTRARRTPNATTETPARSTDVCRANAHTRARSTARRAATAMRARKPIPVRRASALAAPPWSAPRQISAKLRTVATRATAGASTSRRPELRAMTATPALRTTNARRRRRECVKERDAREAQHVMTATRALRATSARRAAHAGASNCRTARCATMGTRVPLATSARLALAPASTIARA